MISGVKKIMGVGTNDYNGKISDNPMIKHAYDVWSGVLQRCYPRTIHKKTKSIEGSKVCDEWTLFSNFLNWYKENYPQHLVDQGVKLVMDKDLLSGDDKLYSPDTCVFLPMPVNQFIGQRKSWGETGHTGVYPVHNRRVGFMARIKPFKSNQRKYLGYFSTIEDASQAYQEARAVEAERVKSYMRDLGYSEDIVNKIK